MAQLEKVREGEGTYVSAPMSNMPRDLLERVMAVGHLPVKLEEEASEDQSQELELTLGLSSNGRFGVDPRAKKIKRTSSIPELLKPVRDEDDVAYAMPRMMGCTPLMRSCSLPTETEEVWRKRKELQTLRRMEARRKRSEKQRNSKAAAMVRERNRALSEEIGEEDKRQEGGGNGNSNELTSLRKTTSLTRACLVGLNLNGGSGLPPTPSSQGIGSSLISESESQPPPQGRTKSLDARSPVVGNLSVITDNLSKLVSPESRSKEIARNGLEDIPCVSTKGEGPNGRRIQGFLYGYKKGEEVRIVCVCHGTFLTPAEFVKHAGGNDVAHPLKHIVVTPSFL